MASIKGPGIFLAQFVRDEAPFNHISAIARWASSLGYRGVQIPTWEAKIFDLDTAAASRGYCQDYQSLLSKEGVAIIELASYLQGQMMAVHPAYEPLFQGFYPKRLNDSQRQAWATEQLLKTIEASVNFGTNNISVLSGGLAWPYLYPWPQRSKRLIDEAFQELARRWKPLLDAAANKGITFGFELHPGSDLCDGATFTRFLDLLSGHPAVGITYDASHFLLQQLDYLGFIRLFGERISAFHVKDAEFRPDGMTGLYGGFNDWSSRAGRFRSLGDGQVDFKQVFSLLTEVGYRGWAILEWECVVKSAQQGAAEGAKFIEQLLIDKTEIAFDDFVGHQIDPEQCRQLLGINS